MGAFYRNITLKGISQKKVIEALRGRRAIISPLINNCIVVFDSACDEQNIYEIQALTARISNELNCIALSIIVHDDDIFGYFLYRNGELVDWYNSCPNYFEPTKFPEAPAGGNAAQLCTSFNVDKQQEVENILRMRRGKPGYIFETKRHEDFARVLGLPALAVGTALANFDRGEYPDGIIASQMVWAADAPSLCKTDSKEKI